MATFELTGPDGGTYHVDAPDEHSALAAFSAFHGTKSTDAAPPPDKYQQAAIDDAAANPAIEGQSGYTRRLVHGVTMGADSTLAAGAFTPAEMLRHGTFDPREGYNYAKAREDLIMNKARENTGALGTAVDVLGGVVSGGGLGKAGVTAARWLPEGAGIVKRSLASAADAAGFGAFSGAMEGNGLAERFNNAVKGLATGAAVGGLTPAALKLAGAALSPVISNIRAKYNPESFAQSQVGRGFHESGKTPNQVSLDVVQAANEGQPQYTVADAMGNAGQRLLSTIARAPGEGRTMAVNASNATQGDQGRRLAGAFQDAFEAPQTAEQTRQAMKAAADREASFNYQPVKADQTAIDVSNPVAIANRAISPAADRLASMPSYEIVPPTLPTDPVARAHAMLNPEPPTYRQIPPAEPTDLAARAGIERQESALRDPIGSALKEARSYLAAPTLTSSNVSQAFRAKTNIDQMIAHATEQGRGALVSELMPIRNSLDEALANTSSNYAKARDAYKLAQDRIRALDLGKDLGSKSVRPEDAIRQFQALADPESRAAFRKGYADPQISQVQNKPFGSDKALPFTSDAVKQEFNAFAAPGRADQLQRIIGREQTMTASRQAAFGGSKTVDNLADEAAMGIDPHLVGLVGHITSGNWGGALKTALSAGHNMWTGNTPEVRKAVADIILQNGRNISPAALNQTVSATIDRIKFVQNIARNLGRGAAGGLAVAGPGQSRGRQ